MHSLVNLAMVFIVCQVPCGSFRSENLFDNTHHCPTGWFTIDTVCYQYVSEPGLTRDEAEARCERHGATLLKGWRTIEWYNLRYLLTENMKDTRVWTALYRDGSGSWVWSNDEPKDKDPPYKLRTLLTTNKRLCAVFHKADGYLYAELCSSTEVPGYVCRKLSEVTYLPGLPWQPLSAVNVTGRMRSSYFYPGPMSGCYGNVKDVTRLQLKTPIECAAKCVTMDGCYCFRWACFAKEFCMIFSCKLVVTP